MQLIQAIWDRIEAWLKVNAPEMMDNLLPGIDEDDIREIEAEMGIELPDDVKASFHIYNGTVDFFIDRWRLHNIDEMVQTRQQMISQFRDDETWWHPAWLPLASDGSGDLICIDLAPVPFSKAPDAEGKKGCIFVFQHDNTDYWIAPSFQALISAFADNLEAGHYHIDEFGGLKSADSLFLFHFTHT